MKKLAITFGLLPTATFAMGSSIFSDVSVDSSYYDALVYVQTEGIVEGYSDGTYQPNQTINRAELTKILAEAQFSSDIEGCTSTDFPDVADDQWFAPYVCAAVEAQVVAGYPDGTFKPADTVNVAEASKMIANSFSLSAGAESDTWFAPFLSELGAKGAIPVEITAAENGLTRGQMAEMIFRLKTNTMDKESMVYSNGSLSLKASVEVNLELGTSTEEETDNEEMNIVETAMNTESLSTLVAAVQAADLVAMLEEDGPFTVFAPTNEAFLDIQTTVDELLLPESQTTLQGVLGFHVVPGSFMAEDLEDGMELTTAQGGTLMVEILDGEVMINGSVVVMADVETSNGIVHVIDTVLVPSAENAETTTEEESSAATEMAAAMYVDYSAELAAELEGAQTYALYFKADWCPTCTIFDANLTEMIDTFPAGTAILRADYDAETELKTKYGVTNQTTVVVIDAEGEVLLKEVDPSIESLKQYWQ